MQDEGSDPLVAVRIENLGDITLIEVRGELDISNIDMLRDALHKVGASDGLRKNLIISFQDVKYVDSTALNEIMGFMHSWDNGKLNVAIVRPLHATGRRVFDIAGMSRITKLSDDVDEATKLLINRAARPH